MLGDQSTYSRAIKKTVVLLEVEAGAPCKGNGRGTGGNDRLALGVEVANWNFTFSSCHSTLPVALWVTCQPEVWDQVISARLEVKMSWKIKGMAADKRPCTSFAQQPPKQLESPNVWLGQS